jgi:hypothetical protein
VEYIVCNYHELSPTAQPVFYLDMTSVLVFVHIIYFKYMLLQFKPYLQMMIFVLSVTWLELVLEVSRNQYAKCNLLEGYTSSLAIFTLLMQVKKLEISVFNRINLFLLTKQELLHVLIHILVYYPCMATISCCS